MVSERSPGAGWGRSVSALGGCARKGGQSSFTARDTKTSIQTVLKEFHDIRPLGVTLDFERPWKRFVLGFTGLVNDMMLKIGVRPALNVPPVNHRHARRRRAPMQSGLVGTPMQRVAMDILGPLPVTAREKKYVLVVSDYFTKWVEAYPMPNMEAKTVAELFVNQFIARFGVPDILHTDQGRNFESLLMKETCQLLGVQKTRTSPYHPQSDGLIERFNRTLFNMLSSC